MTDPMDEPWTEADDVIEEVRAIRREISARFDDDVRKLGAFLMESQKRHGDRLVYPGWRPDSKPASWNEASCPRLRRPAVEGGP